MFWLTSARMFVLIFPYFLSLWHSIPLHSDTHTHIHTSRKTHTHALTHTYTQAPQNTHAHKHMRVETHALTQTQKTHTHSYTHTHKSPQHTRTHTSAETLALTHTNTKQHIRTHMHYSEHTNIYTIMTNDWTVYVLFVCFYKYLLIPQHVKWHIQYIKGMKMGEKNIYLSICYSHFPPTKGGWPKNKSRNKHPPLAMSITPIFDPESVRDEN